MAPSFPTPKFVTGGCVCNSLRYHVDFPADHDFEKSVSFPIYHLPSYSSHTSPNIHQLIFLCVRQSGTCQCTQCRKQSGSLFFSSHVIKPASRHFKFTSPTTTLKVYRASAEAERVICGECGSWIYWKPSDDDYVCFTVGTVDPLYLFGEGADGVDVPEDGFGVALANGGGEHCYIENEIKGVTDKVEILGKGKGNGEKMNGE
jgi:hypothetical protein